MLLCCTRPCLTSPTGKFATAARSAAAWRMPSPAAELPAVAVALEARFRLLSQTGERWVAASDFYQGLFTTDLCHRRTLGRGGHPTRTAESRVCVRRSGAPPRRLCHGGRGRRSRARRRRAVANSGQLLLLSVGDCPVPARQAAAALQGPAPTADLITVPPRLPRPKTSILLPTSTLRSPTGGNWQGVGTANADAGIWSRAAGQ